jgi:hypothetical protein
MTNKIKIEVEFDFENALERSKAEPPAAAEELRGAVKKGRSGRYRTLRESMATCCAIFQHLRPNEMEWRAFLSKAQEVETEYKPRENPELAAVVLYVFSGTSYTQVIKYAAGLQLLIDQGVEPADMPKVIKDRGGIDELYTEATTKKRKKTAASPATRARSTKSSKRAKRATDDVSSPDTADAWDSADDLDDAEQADGEGDGPSAVRAKAKAKREAGRVAGKLARIAVEHDSEWILCEVDRTLFKPIIKSTKSAAFSSGSRISDPPRAWYASASSAFLRKAAPRLATQGRGRVSAEPLYFSLRKTCENVRLSMLRDVDKVSASTSRQVNRAPNPPSTDYSKLSAANWKRFSAT